jgi:hypothetical protein
MATKVSGGPWAAALNNKALMDTGLTALQQKALTAVEDPKERARMMTTFALQNHQEFIEWLSSLMKKMHETGMALVRNF